VFDGVFTPDGYAVNTNQAPYQPSQVPPAAAGPATHADPAKYTLPPQTLRTIGDTLSAKGVSWAWYAGGWDAAVRDGMQPPGAKRTVIYGREKGAINFQPHHQPFNYFARFAPGTADRARLNDYLVRSKQKEMTIELLEDRLLVNARPRLLGIPASVRVTGPLLPDGAKLNLKIESLEVIGVGVPLIAADFVEWKVNPVVDMATTGFAPHLRAVEISPQGIRIRGAANIAAALEGSDSR
jgi:hypothetical protein